jgi:hypothetical protein
MRASKSSVEHISGENRALKISSSVLSRRVAKMSASICSALPAKIERSSPSGAECNSGWAMTVSLRLPGSQRTSAAPCLMAANICSIAPSGRPIEKEGMIPSSTRARKTLVLTLPPR